MTVDIQRIEHVGVLQAMVMEKNEQIQELAKALAHAVHWHDQLQPHDITRFRTLLAKHEAANG
jgi:hypothetical protein